jgi:signal transduction histidine kinase/ActR/RegA family two-component response regulator
MFRWFARLQSFGDKVTWLVTLTSGLAIVAVCFTLAVLDYFNLRRDTMEALRAQSLIVAMNSGAPLAFGDRASGGEALAALRVRPGVASAALFDTSGARFAEFRRGFNPGPSLPLQPLGTTPVDPWLVMVLPVHDRGVRLGHLQVVYDPTQTRAHLWRTLALSSIVAAFAVLLVYLFAQRIKDTLIHPIAALGATALQVSGTRNYSLRATKVSEDELGTFTDIFNEMLAQIELQNTEIQASRAEAQHASQLKDDFLATLSHELRTPMTPILGWAQILRRTARDNPQVLQAAEVIERNARVQTQIVDDLLDMSRIIAGKVRLEVQPVDLAQVIDAAVETVATAAEARGIHVVKALQTTVPVRGDPQRLQQVLWNLLSNAIKFTPRDGTVTVTLERQAGYVQVGVQDTGQGIAPEFMPYVFERFRQADSSTTRQHGGLGLGLAIVKQLVELHGGSVRVRSDGAGLGSLFTVRLPLVPVRALSDGSHPPMTAPSVGAATPAEPARAVLAGLRLLVVDDEPDARDLVEHLLRDSGAEVAVAASGDEALERFRAAPPDLVVCDIGMPGMDGLQLIRAIRELPAARGGQVPAIALTAFARSEERTRSLQAGFQLHVAKPVEEAELVAAIASLARLAQGESAKRAAPPLPVDVPSQEPRAG